MILATDKDTGRIAYIFVKEIVKTEKMKSGPCSFTRVYIQNPGLKYDYFLDVKESPEELKRRIREERHGITPKKEGGQHEK